MKKIILALFLLSAITQTNAHVILEQTKAAAGSYHKLTFKVGHGCDGSATHTFKVTLPEEAMNAKPVPKAGWKLETILAPLRKPYNSYGKTVTSDVREIVWSGNLLSDAYYDEFAIQVQLTETPGKLYFKVTQLCEKGRLDWVEIPAEGQNSNSLKSPAPMLEVVAKITAEHSL